MNTSIPIRWFLLPGLISLLLGALGFFAASFFDQVIRNRVDEHMYGYALRELLPSGLDDYQAMPIHWRQVISEISIRKKVVGDSESKILFAMLEHFDVEQLHLVDKIVPYMMFDFLVRDTSRTDTAHPIHNAVYADFLDLESLGVLQSVHNGTIIHRNIVSGPYVIHSGSHTVTIRRGQGSTDLVLRTTRISEPWVKLIGLLRIPTNEEYIEWFASKIEEEGFNVEVTRKNQR